ncbi:MAG: BACON domain-containing protein [Alistipes sp.]|nr:BACON domain-containing protein [Alistipes sp.]
MANKLFKSFFAVALVLGSALGFVACEDKGDDVVADPKVEVSATSLNFTMEEGSQSVELTANSDWKVEVDDADWVTVTPTAGKGDATLTVAVAMNESGAVRTSIVKVIALHKEYGNWDTKKITVSQSASETPTVEEELLYGDDFDAEEATKTYGSGSSWPYLDQFPQFANPEGPAAENVTYSGKGVSIRANSTSDSQYSDYAGSGSNNIFFGSSAYFQVNNITLAEGQQNLKLTFGSEKYTQDGDSTFKNEEFHIYLSKDGNGWAEIKEYTFAGTEGGRWNVATAEFSLTSVPETLYLKFAADVASVYRLDDVKLFSGNGGQTIDLDNIEVPEPAEGPYASDAPFVCSTDDSTNAVYSLGATTIDGYSVTGFKLGKGKQTGLFKSGAVGVSGDKYLNLYAVAWKGGDAKLYFRVDGGATQTLEIAPNDGASNNAPYTALTLADTDHYSVKLSGLSATSTIEFSTDANFELTSADATISYARAIVCGVKLTDEPINGEGGGNEEPENPIEGSVTIAEAIAAADNTAIVIENATVIGVYSRGVLVEDTTGKLLVYVGSAVDAKVGDVVKVEGAMATYGGLRQVGTPTVTVTGSTSYTYPTATVMDGAAMDAYLSNPVIQYVEYTGTLAISGYYYNVSVDGAATAVGSLAYVIDGTVDPALDGQQILVKGWTIGFSGGKYVNTMITSVTAADGGTTEPEPTPSEVHKVTVAEFLAAAEDDTIYELTGEITSVANTTYGNFYLKDETAEVYIYGLCSPEGEQKYWAESGVKVGDTITVQTVRTSYNGTPQGKNAIYVSHISVEVEEPVVPEGSTVATITFADAGYANAEVVDGVTIALDENVSVVFSQGGANNAPAYYESGQAIRMYQNGATLDVTANGKTIQSIELTFANNHYYVAADCGELSEEAAVRTWTGESTAVKFTSTGTDKDHRAYVAALKVTYKN